METCSAAAFASTKDSLNLVSAVALSSSVEVVSFTLASYSAFAISTLRFFESNNCCASTTFFAKSALFAAK